MLRRFFIFFVPWPFPFEKIRGDQPPGRPGETNLGGGMGGCMVLRCGASAEDAIALGDKSLALAFHTFVW